MVQGITENLGEGECQYRNCELPDKKFPKHTKDQKFCCDKHRISEWNLLNPRMKKDDPRQISYLDAPRTAIPNNAVQREIQREDEKRILGMEQSAQANGNALAEFRTIAERLSGEITIDDVRAVAEREGIKYTPGPWIGSTFKEGFVWTGRVKPSTHEGSHGRLIRIWERKP